MVKVKVEMEEREAQRDEMVSVSASDGRKLRASSAALALTDRRKH
jgi:hypothetical protein